MKKTILAIFLGITLICTVIFANPTMNKSHKKAAIVKEKGHDIEKLKTGEFCATKECHPSVDKK